MKKILMILITALMFAVNMNGQTYKYYETRNIHNELCLNTETGLVIQVQDDGQKFIVNKQLVEGGQKNRYELIPTQNIWNFILLDKFQGKLYQCQFSVEGTDYIMTVPINNIPLSYSNKPIFYVKPLVSMYQFYLINGDNGERWKFQWSTKGDDYRWIEKQ